MSFPWHAYDKWLTTTPQDREHLPECHCQDCHEGHKEESMVPEYSVLGYQCCVDEFDVWVSEGRACKKHPLAYHELHYCEECESGHDDKSSPSSH